MVLRLAGDATTNSTPSALSVSGSRAARLDGGDNPLAPSKRRAFALAGGGPGAATALRLWPDLASRLQDAAAAGTALARRIGSRRSYAMQPRPAGSEFRLCLAGNEQRAALLELCCDARSKAAERSLGIGLALTGPTKLSLGAELTTQTDAEIGRLLRSVALSELPQACSVDIFLWNNGPARHLPDLHGLSVIMVNSRRDIGAAQAHNVMMSRAFNDGADCYLRVAADGFLEPQAILSLLRMAAAHDGQALVEAARFPVEHAKAYHPETFETSWASGHCMLYPAAIWRRLGGFDGGFQRECDDVDLSWRARRLGLAALTCPHALFFRPEPHAGAQGAPLEARKDRLRLGYKWRARQGAARKSASGGASHAFSPFAQIARGLHFGESRW